MRFAKRLLMVAGAVALSGIVSVMVAPKAVHAIVSTLVTVANTSANPVPVTEGTDLAREPFATSICADSDGTICLAIGKILGIATPPASFTVPVTDAAGSPVKALVIQFVSGICNQVSPVLQTSAPANAVNGINKTINFLNTVTPSTGNSSPLVNQTTSIVADGGSTIAMLPSVMPSGDSCFLTVNGYLAQ
ncbi:MAG: hypothetical protein WBE21_07975 [Candidatus Acidiferrales bacterium]|nr:hypothetical protein [Candidatus Acidoferrales bacterium]